MVYGLPVICSDFPNLRRIVAENDCGLCVNPEDDEAIAEAVRYLSEYPEEADRLGNNGRRAAQTHFHWDLQAEKLLALYGDLT